MSTANELLVAACTSGISCLDEMNLLRVIAQGAMSGGGGGGSGMAIGGAVTSGTPGSVLFIGAGGTLAQDNANFFWDDTTDRLGLVTNSPVATLDVNGVGAFGNGVVGAPSISFRNDLDCGFWRPGANIVALSTAGAERVRVDASGNVGIGNTNPSERLDLTGNIRLTGALQYGADYYQTFNSGVLRYDQGNLYPSGFRFEVGSGVGIFVNSIGNAGIGTISPTAVLHLKAGTAAANTSPLKFTAGVLLATPEIGSAEFTDDGTTAHFFITVRVATVVTRVQLA